jgi:serine/threonine-protein kinase
VARALVKAHAHGVIHRDLKPENLFLTRKEDGGLLVKILDFGIAKVEGARTLTKSHQSLGTPTYMAPEQAETDSPGRRITSRTDGFALGLVAFRLLVGKSYWIEGSMPALVRQLLVEPMPPPSERGSSLGPAFDAWFLRACHRDPSERFASCDQQIEALAAALGPLECASGRPSDQRVSGAARERRKEARVPRGRWRAALVASSAAAILLAAVAVAALVVWFGRRNAEQRHRATETEAPAVSSASAMPNEKRP